MYYFLIIHIKHDIKRNYKKGNFHYAMKQILKKVEKIFDLNKKTSNLFFVCISDR